MKTDRFTDIIRRKLESIRPDFTDKDWARMQSTLRDANLSQPNTPGANQPFSGGVWSGQSWLMAAASISTVALIAFSIWQRREINQLRQTIGQLHPKSINQTAPNTSTPALKEQPRSDIAHSNSATPSKQTQEAISSANRNESQAVRPDTVYITRYVAVPSRAKPDVRSEERFSQRTETSIEQQQATETPLSPSATTRQPTNLTYNQQTESYDASSTPSVAKNNTNESTITDKSTANSSVKEKGSISQTTRERNRKGVDTSPTKSLDNRPDRVVTNSPGNAKGKEATMPDQRNESVDKPVTQTEPSTIANQTSATYELAASLPLSIPNKNWNAALAQRARRMQPARSTVVVIPATPVVEQTQAPASQVQQVATRFRMGISGEIAPRLWNAGVFTEVLLGRHFTLGVGLSQATYTNQFITDDDFNNRTQRDFRKEFGRTIEPWRDILNIDTRQVRLQVPISLGYRISLNQTLSLVPTVGTYLNLDNSENITFYCRQPYQPPMKPLPQRGIDEFQVNASPSVNLINTLSLGAGVEWQRGHWVVQATPLINIPTQTAQQAKQTELSWQKNTTVGLRARLLYQF